MFSVTSIVYLTKALLIRSCRVFYIFRALITTMTVTYTWILLLASVLLHSSVLAHESCKGVRFINCPYIRLVTFYVVGGGLRPRIPPPPSRMLLFSHTVMYAHLLYFVNSFKACSISKSRRTFLLHVCGCGSQSAQFHENDQFSISWVCRVGWGGDEKDYRPGLTLWRLHLKNCWTLMSVLYDDVHMDL